MPRCARSLLALALAACQGPSPAQPATSELPATPPATTVDPGKTTADTKPPDPSPTKSPPTKSLPNRALPDDPATPPDADAPPSEGASYTPGPLAITAIDRGALVVWSRHDASAGKSEILAITLDEQGLVKGTPRLVRRTSGQILDLVVHRRDGAAWLAWFSLLAEEPRARALVAALSLEPDLSAVRPPITLGQFSDETILAWPERDLLRILDLASGSAAVAAAGPVAQCVDIVTDRPSKCPAFNLFFAHIDGTFVRAGHQGADGGDPGIISFIDLGTGVLLDTYAWHGGATYSTLHAAHDQPSSPLPNDLKLPDCHPPFERAFTGAELVTLCPGDYAAEDEKCSLNGTPADEGTCAHIHAVTLDGKQLTRTSPNRLTAMTTQKTKCIDGHPVIEVGWKGGQILKLDPLAPGASFDLDLGVWTGSHAIKISEDGARERWSCTKGQFALADTLADPFPLDPPARDLKSVPGAAP